MKSDKHQTFFLFTFILIISISTLFVENENIEALEKLYKNCEYQKVITLADKFLESNTLKSDDKARVYILKGISEYTLHQTLNSEITFLELLEKNNNVELDHNEVSPKIITLVDKLKSKIHQQSSQNSNIPPK